MEIKIDLAFNDSTITVLSKEPDKKYVLRYCQVDKFMTRVFSFRFKLYFTELFLHCPLHTLVPSVYERFLRKSKASQAIYHFRRLTVTPYIITTGVREFYSESLFDAGAETPCRFIIGFVTNEQFLGSFDTNPFDFRRRWSKKTTNTSGKEVLQSFWISKISIKVLFSFSFLSSHQTRSFRFLF